MLFDNNTPGVLAHGGFHIQVQQTIRGIGANGVETDYLRWWEEDQPCDIIHHFGRPHPGYIAMAHTKGIKVVVLPLLSAVGSRSPMKLRLQKMLFAMARTALPPNARFRFGWDAFLEADACIANTAVEANLMTSIYGAPPEHVHIIANGIEDVFVNSKPTQRGPWLVCTATVTERKRVLETAQAAVLAQTPFWVVGKPYSDIDPYGREFAAFVKANPKLIRYEGAFDDRATLAKIYREARGFVLLSQRETLSLSSFEAAACECPLLLTDLPWATETFKDRARYCPIAPPTETAKFLREFYDAAPKLPLPPKPKSWVEIGAEFKKVYEKVLSASR